ncbi:MAG: tRNA lysidine(34) synthetase TilS [Polyangiaceae bacterium]|nr:tRNA lysidine(34) synthetase TilS [Polyangiaceae bacterium]
MTERSDIARHGGRTHPPSLIRLCERLLREEELIGAGETVLCACSGGPDSTALVHVLGKLAPKFRFRVAAHGVDHGLRPEALGELEHAARVCKSLGVPFSITRVHIEPGGNIQARAREARRRALRSAARGAGASLIATGHTSDDRAETLILRLLRGAGPRGLAVMPPRSMLEKCTPDDSEIYVVRPLLLARRVDVMAHLARHEVSFAEDPSNADPRFLRVRVRREVMPLLTSMSPKITEHLCALAEMLGDLPAENEAFESLGRAQRMAARRAKKCKQPIKLRVSGGHDVEVAFSAGEAVLMKPNRRRSQPVR